MSVIHKTQFYYELKYGKAQHDRNDKWKLEDVSPFSCFFMLFELALVLAKNKERHHSPKHWLDWQILVAIINELRRQRWDL